jgi:hypothetical protein
MRSQCILEMGKAWIGEDQLLPRPAGEIRRSFWSRFVECDQFFGARHGQGLEHHGVKQGENRYVRAEAEREAQRRSSRETWRSPQGPPRVPHIPPDRI